jgi:SPP1 family predicted phage head-tail adaptor
MRIGELRKQVALQAETPTSDNAGGYALAWTTLATLWADIAPLNGNEVFAAQHLEGHVTHRVTLRYRSDVMITSEMRILYNNRAFNIRSVLNTDERNRWLELLVEEGGAV